MTTCRSDRVFRKVSAIAAIGLACLTITDAAGQDLLITNVNRTVVPVGETMLFSGQGLTNATQVVFHWFGYEFSAAFAPASNGMLSVTMPSVRQDARAHYVSLRTAQASTLGLPPGAYYDNGPDPSDLFAPAVVVPAGQEFTLDWGVMTDLIYVETGGILNCPSVMSQTIFAEDGAVLDVSGHTSDQQFVGTFYLSPGTILVGQMPAEAMMVDVTVRQIPPVSLSPDIGYFYVGFTLTVRNEGPGTVSVSPEKPYFAYNELISLTAAPDPERFFVRWIGNAQGMENPVSIRMKGNSAVTGRFALNPDYFRTWLPMYFTAEELADTEISGMGGDPDGDGYTNAAEYLFGSNPRVAEDANRIYLVRASHPDDGLKLSIQFVRPAWAADASYRVEVTQDMATWQFNGDGTDTVYSQEAGWEDIGDGLERVTVALFPETNLPDSAAFRVHATLVE